MGGRLMAEFCEFPQSDEMVPAHLLRLRNEERIELIMSFYRGLKVFRDLSRKSRATAQGFRYDDMDRLIEANLRQVKDSCHRLFRESKRSEANRLLEAVFDMYFGILFHILLKAKENLRLRENYNIRRLEGLLKDLRATRQMSMLPGGVTQLFNRLAGEFQRESEELQDEMTGARFIFNQLEKVFNRVIQVYADNATIIRSLYCQKDFFAELFPGRGINRLFDRIYPKNGPAEAYLFLGFDFLRSGHVAQAHETLAQAVKAARQRRMPPSRLRQLYHRYREQTLAGLRESGDSALAFQLRLRECEEHPPLRALTGEQPAARQTTGRGRDPRESVAVGA
jgi:hypothetical protein